MSSAPETLLRIVDPATPPDRRTVAMREFAEDLRWTPNYEVRGSFGVESVASHLVVEHGLENTATISFLKAPQRASDLTPSELRALLTVSYNNLVEWHLFVSENEARWINNLAESEQDERADRLHRLVAGDTARYLSAAYLSGPTRAAMVQRTLKACDEALLQVVSRWKRLLRADYPTVDNRNISALFNALILVRGCEDRDLDRPSGYTRGLLQIVQDAEGLVVDLPAVLQEALSRSAIKTALNEFVAEDALRPFAELDRATALNLVNDLYGPRDAAYNFNFSLMSKHALSRIYEKYVALLRDPLENAGTSRQLTFIAEPPSEEQPVRTGAVYTPQFIAGFFARYIRENTTPRRFRSLKTIDPACGSGIFLRTLLELQCDPLVPGITQGAIETAFSQTFGIDKDPNACEATRLSLALLHLIATNRLPRANELRISNRDAIAAALQGDLEQTSFGAVLTNPPYIKLDHLPMQERATYRSYLQGREGGRLDAYLAMAHLSLDLCEPGGFVCLVLQQTFLTAANASGFRRRIEATLMFAV